MKIWFDSENTLERLKNFGVGTVGKLIGMEWLELGDNFLKAKLPVDERTTQQYGFLHGGISCVLAETIGSVASAMVIDTSKFYCVGLEINANHIRSAKEGFVIGLATPLHLGATTHVWDIKINDEKDRLICVSRLTVAIIKIRDENHFSK